MIKVGTIRMLFNSTQHVNKDICECGNSDFKVCVVNGLPLYQCSVCGVVYYDEVQ